MEQRTAREQATEKQRTVDQDRVGRPGPPQQFARRAALRVAGGAAVALGAAACGGEEPPQELPTGTEPPGASGEPVTLDVARFDAAGACQRTAEQIEGPFYQETGQLRRDITDGAPGEALRVGLRVRDLDEGCAPRPEALVELWQADAGGLYSGLGAAEQGRSGVEHEHAQSTALRGAQLTDTDGIAEFVSIHPGRYPGRTPHLHVKVHLDEATVLTSQLYFDDELNAEVLAGEAYAGQGEANPPTSNDEDGFFERELVLDVTAEANELVGVLTLDVARP